MTVFKNKNKVRAADEMVERLPRGIVTVFKNEKKVRATGEMVERLPSGHSDGLKKNKGAGR